MTTPGAWWRRYPRVWGREHSALQRLDPAARVVDRRVGRGVQRTVRLMWPPASMAPDWQELARRLNGRVREPFWLVCSYPSSYPWFPPVVRTAALRDLTHHRDASGVLCLLASDDDWSPVDTLAGLLRRQMPHLIQAGLAQFATGDEPADLAGLMDLEVQGPEPSWLPLVTWGSRAFVDDDTPWPEGPWGPAVVGHRLQAPQACFCYVQPAGLTADEPGEGPQWLRSLRSMHVSDWVLTSFPSFRAGAWVRLDAAPRRSASGIALWELVRERVPPPLMTVLEKLDRAVVVLRFPDEVGWRRVGEQSLALVHSRSENTADGSADRPVDGRADSRVEDGGGGVHPVSGATARGPADMVRRERGEPTVLVAAVQPLGRTALTARSPQAASLRDKDVVVAGLGALGGPVALELARAGVGSLLLLDCDVHMAGNSGRQVPDLYFASLPKSVVMEELLRRRSPHATVTGVLVRLGAHPPELHDDLLLRMSRAHLVCDLTASLAVTRFLSAHCREVGTPFVMGAATPGAWGGSVISLDPQRTRPCWQCVELHRMDGLLPAPPSLPEQAAAAGCGSPSFVGTAYELAPVWQQVVSVAVGKLVGDELPHLAFDADAFTLSSRDPQGQVTAPTWQQLTLPVHPGCPRHPPTGAARKAARRT